MFLSTIALACMSENALVVGASFIQGEEPHLLPMRNHHKALWTRFLFVLALLQNLTCRRDTSFEALFFTEWPA